MPARVLLVDDDAQVTTLLTEYLGGLGYETAAVNDGFFAAAAFMKFRPDLVILDYRMPASTGALVIERLRALEGGRDLPIIVLSGEPLSILRTTVAETERVRIVSKPPSLGAIGALVARLLGPKAA